MMWNAEGCDNIIIYERMTEEMGKGKKGKQKTQDETPKQQDKILEQQDKIPEKQGIRFGEYIKNNIPAFVVGILVAAVWWLIHDVPQSIQNLEASVLVINAQLENLYGNYSNLNSQVWSINVSKISEGHISNEVEPVILMASTELSTGMSNAQIYNGNKENFAMDMSAFERTAVIGKNIETQKEETKEDVENNPFITHYTENEEDVFFYGKYNENSRWDGKCIINRYKDSKLTLIMEADYDNGVLINYKQVFKGKNSSGQALWYISNRTVEGEKNSGETTTYFFYGDCEKKFDIQTIREKNILSVENFLETIPSTMEGYYSGYTSDGRYNDDSGDAYLVKYGPDGSVRLLYVGNIQNGVPHDSTGKAWAISWGYANDGYYYYQGIFTNGDHGKAPKNWTPMEQEEINQKVHQKDFNCPLTGLLSEGDI